MSPTTSAGRREAVPDWIADCPGVSFVDSTGAWWCVSERSCRADDPPDMRCLVFMSEFAARRVLSFPPDWQRLTPDQLEALSWKR